MSAGMVDLKMCVYGREDQWQLIITQKFPLKYRRPVRAIKENICKTVQ
jgi:hypothetical protein